MKKKQNKTPTIITYSLEFIDSLKPQRSENIPQQIARKYEKYTQSYGEKQLSQFLVKSKLPSSTPRTVFSQFFTTEQVIQRNIMSILNKVNNENIKDLVVELCPFLKSQKEVEFFIELLFKKAINESKYCQMYVKFFTSVKDISGEKQLCPTIDRSIFSRLLVEKSKQIFRDKKSFNTKSTTTNGEQVQEQKTEEEKEEEKYQQELKKLEFFGTLRLICQLYIQKAIKVQLPLLCLDEMLQDTSLTDILLEGSHVMLKEIWKDIQNQVTKDISLYSTNDYLHQQLNSSRKKSSQSPRIQPQQPSLSFDEIQEVVKHVERIIEKMKRVYTQQKEMYSKRICILLDILTKDIEKQWDFNALWKEIDVINEKKKQIISKQEQEKQKKAMMAKKTRKMQNSYSTQTTHIIRKGDKKKEEKKRKGNQANTKHRENKQTNQSSDLIQYLPYGIIAVLIGILALLYVLYTSYYSSNFN